MKRLLYPLLFISVLIYWDCEDKIKTAESSETQFSVTFDIGKNDRVLDIEKINDNKWVVVNFLLNV